MFWGVRIQSGRKYSQEVSHSYQITKAVLETPVDGSNKNSNKRVHLMHQNDDGEILLATLDNNNVERSLDIHFSLGEKVCLFLKGEGTVHLSGYIVDFGDDDDEDYSDEENPFVSAEEFAKAAKRGIQENGNSAPQKKQKVEDEDESEDDDDFELGDLDEEFDDESDEFDDEEGELDEEEEDEDDIPQLKNGSVKPQQQQQQQQQKKGNQNAKPQQQQQQQKKQNQTPQNNKGQPQKQQQQQPQSQKKGQQAAQQQQQVKKVQNMDNKKGTFTPPTKSANSTKTPDGLEIFDMVKGSGPVAKKGKTVHVKYIGKLTNNKEFDRSTNKPFSFRLGEGEVIQGWEKGIEGMQVGGKRRLVIPPKLAYGNQRTGPIPANSTLDFEVQLVRVG